MKKSFYIFLILILGLISFTWFKGDLVVSGGDYPFNFLPKISFFSYFSTWSNLISLGGGNTQALTHLFEQFIYFFGSFLNIPLWLIQRVIFYLLFVTGGISVFLFAEKKLKLDLVLSFWAALFYMFNIYSLVFVWGILSILMFAYAVYPLLLYLFARGIEERKARWILIFNFAGLFFSSFSGNFSYVLTLWALLSSYLFFFFFFVM